MGVAGEYKMSLDCAHNSQRPEVTKKVRICMDCGADTKPFETEAPGKSQQISEGSGDKETEPIAASPKNP